MLRYYVTDHCIDSVVWKMSKKLENPKNGKVGEGGEGRISVENFVIIDKNVPVVSFAAQWR